MSIAVSLPLGGVPLDQTVAFVRRSQEWGYTAAWGSEVAGPDFASLLGAVAVGAPGLDLGVAVAPVQTRSPWLLAATAATLSELSGGRFSLGVGTSSEVIVEQWSGIPFERPLERLRETVELLRTILSGERTDLDGEFLRSHGYRLPSVPAPPVPLLVGALNPKSLRQAGAIGDGVCLNQLGPDDVPTVLAEVRAGAQEAGRETTGMPVVARLFCRVTDDVASAREEIRRTFAPYAATRVYNRFFRWLGYAEEMDAVVAAARERDRAAMAAALSDRFVDALYVLGDPDEVAARVQAYLDAGVTTAAIACVAPGAGESERTLRAIGERVSG